MNGELITRDALSYQRAMARRSYALPARIIAAGPLPVMQEPVTIERLPLPVDLVLYRGDDFRMMIDVAGPDGEPADLSRSAARAQIRAAPDDEQASDFTAFIDAGTVTLHLPAAVSARAPARGVWDCRLTDDSFGVLTLTSGTVTMMPDVTR